MEIYMQTKRLQWQAQSSKYSGRENTTLKIYCVLAARKSSLRADLIMFSIEGLEHFRRSQPSSRTGTLIFHEFSGKTSSFPPIQQITQNQKNRPFFWNIKLVLRWDPTFPRLFSSSIMKPGVLVQGYIILTMNQLELKEQQQ